MLALTLWDFTVKLPPHSPGWWLPCAWVEMLVFRRRDKQDPQRPEQAGVGSSTGAGAGNGSECVQGLLLAALALQGLCSHGTG